MVGASILTFEKYMIRPSHHRTVVYIPEYEIFPKEDSAPSDSGESIIAEDVPEVID